MRAANPGAISRSRWSVTSSAFGCAMFGLKIVLDAPGRTVFKRIAVGKSPEGVLIPPDGGRAFVAVNGDNVVAVLDLKTWTVTRKLQTGTGPDGMAWVR